MNPHMLNPPTAPLAFNNDPSQANTERRNSNDRNSEEEKDTEFLEFNSVTTGKHLPS
jgi:hypothetical protein